MYDRSLWAHKLLEREQYIEVVYDKWLGRGPGICSIVHIVTLNHTECRVSGKAPCLLHLRLVSRKSVRQQ